MNHKKSNLYSKSTEITLASTTITIQIKTQMTKNIRTQKSSTSQLLLKISKIRGRNQKPQIPLKLSKSVINYLSFQPIQYIRKLITSKKTQITKGPNPNHKSPILTQQSK